MNRLESEFKKEVESESSYNVYHCYIGSYLIRLWAGRLAKSIPNETMDSILDYTNFEVEVFCTKKHGVDNSLTEKGVRYYSVDTGSLLGIYWTEIGLNSRRGLRQSVETIIAVMDGISKIEGSGFVSNKEGPCKKCKKPNDLGVGECWWCGTSNPV
jgi:hypothetical protein